MVNVVDGPMGVGEEKMTIELLQSSRRFRNSTRSRNCLTTILRRAICDPELHGGLRVRMASTPWF